VAGHSKWKNIAHRKGKQDASRGQLFTRLCRDIYSSARRGGGNPDTNYHLKLALDKARAASVPSDTIARTVGKATGTLDGVHYEDFIYEGYGPGGSAVMLELSSNNRNRTAAEIRHLFSKYGGSLGESGCVAWLFTRVGAIAVARQDAARDEDDMTLAALEAGAQDIQYDLENEQWIVYASVESLTEVEQALRAQGVVTESVSITYLPLTPVAVTLEDEDRVTTLLALLEEHEDVQSLYTNVEFSS